MAEFMAQHAKQLKLSLVELLQDDHDEISEAKKKVLKIRCIINQLFSMLSVLFCTINKC